MSERTDGVVVLDGATTALEKRVRELEKLPWDLYAAVKRAFVVEKNGRYENVIDPGSQVRIKAAMRSVIDAAIPPATCAKCGGAEHRCLRGELHECPHPAPSATTAETCDHRDDGGSDSYCAKCNSLIVDQPAPTSSFAHGCTHLVHGCCADRAVCDHGVACTHGECCFSCWRERCPENAAPSSAGEATAPTLTMCAHGINHRGERHGCDGCCRTGWNVPDEAASVDVEALVKLLDKATRRPWRVTSGIVPSIDKVERLIVEAVHRSTDRGGYVVANCGPVGEYGSSNDADLIVAAIHALPSLLTDLATARAACDELKNANSKLNYELADRLSRDTFERVQSERDTARAEVARITRERDELEKERDATEESETRQRERAKRAEAERDMHANRATQFESERDAATKQRDEAEAACAAMREAIASCLTGMLDGPAIGRVLHAALALAPDIGKAWFRERDELWERVRDAQALLEQRRQTIQTVEAERDGLRTSLVGAESLIEDLMGYALPSWDWKYGDYWREEQGKVRAALASEAAGLGVAGTGEAARGAVGQGEATHSASSSTSVNVPATTAETRRVCAECGHQARDHAPKCTYCECDDFLSAGAAPPSSASEATRDERDWRDEVIKCAAIASEERAKSEAMHRRAQAAESQLAAAVARVRELEEEKTRDEEYLRDVLRKVNEEQKGLAVCSWCALPTNSDNESKSKHQRECPKSPLVVELSSLLRERDDLRDLIRRAANMIEAASESVSGYDEEEDREVDEFIAELRAALTPPAPSNSDGENGGGK